MRLRSSVEMAITVLLIVFVVSLVLGQLLGQPILLSYVTTGSMEPTISAGDGFLVVPTFLAGEAEPGDVVVFEAVELHDGGLTTHRVVEETERGYVTKGDANPFTDQDGGEPHVTDRRVVAKAVQIDGDVVVVPHLGTAVMAVHSGLEGGQRGLAALLGLGSGLDRDQFGLAMVGLGALFLALALLTGNEGKSTRDSHRSASREGVVAAWAVAGSVIVVVVLLATAAMVIPAGVQEYGIVSADEPDDDPLVIESGTSGTVQYEIHNDGFVPIFVVLEPGSDGVAVTPDRFEIGSRDAAEATVTLSAPDRSGYATRHVVEHRYLLVLPSAVIVALHDLHPVLALGVINAVIGAVFLLLSIALLGTGDLRFRSPGSHVPLGTRLRRKLRRWF